MKFSKLSGLVVAGLLLSNCAGNSEEIELRIKQSIGDELLVVCSTETSSEAQMSYKSVMEMDFKVSSIDKNIYNYTSDLVTIIAETNMMGEVESYNSDKKESDMTDGERLMHADFKGVLDSTFEISIDDKGKIVKPFHYLNGKKVETALVDVSTIMINLPETKVKVGSEWESEKVNPITSQKTKTNYSVKSITDKEVTITANSIVSPLTGLLDESKITGEYILDKKTCTLIKANLDMNLQRGGGKVTYLIYVK